VKLDLFFVDVFYCTLF